MNDAMPLAALTIGQAKEVISVLVAQELQKVLTPKEKPVRDEMNLNDALQFLQEQGLSTTKSALYNRVSKGSIPYWKIGSLTFFSRKELLQWIESRTYRPHSQSDEALRLAESTRKK